MAHSSKQGWGCLPMFLLWGVMLFGGAFGSKELGNDHFLSSLFIFVVIGIAIEVAISKNQNEKSMPEKLKVAEAREQEKRSQYVKHLNNVKYIGGHESFSTHRNITSYYGEGFI